MPHHFDWEALDEAWQLLGHAYVRISGRIERGLQESAALTFSQFRTLLLLSQVPDGRHMNDLAQALAISKSGLTRLIDRLQAAGLVERVTSPTDRRVVLARLTAAGSELLGRALPSYRGALGSSLGSFLAAEELASLTSVLHRLVEGLEIDDSAA